MRNIRERRNFLKLILYSSLFFYSNQFVLASKKLTNTKILSSLIFKKHIISENHPEKPERIEFIIKAIKTSGLMNIFENFNLTRKVENWIRLIHSEEHINLLKLAFPLAERVSQHAVKICLEGVDRIMNGVNKNIFCATRPPGHHALNTGKDEGFCFYNHIAITAKYIQKKYKLSKILIVDWDYHHGNSTEYFFYDDPSILFFSTHDQFAYPGTGTPDKIGIGKGKGFNINIHLPCQTTNNQIIEVFKNILIPRANRFKPEFILISSGFDSRINDLLGCYNVNDEGFVELTRIVKKLANIHCNDRLLSVLEGGYNLEGNAKATIAHVKELNNFI
jgi:acetoin utilization deacetylase AcuC-like enzyme